MFKSRMEPTFLSASIQRLLENGTVIVGSEKKKNQRPVRRLFYSYYISSRRFERVRDLISRSSLLLLLLQLLASAKNEKSLILVSPRVFPLGSSSVVGGVRRTKQAGTTGPRRFGQQKGRVCACHFFILASEHLVALEKGRGSSQVNVILNDGHRTLPVCYPLHPLAHTTGHHEQTRLQYKRDHSSKGQNATTTVDRPPSVLP
jgi:hypothetical protein